jgi:hypothetical protein
MAEAIARRSVSQQNVTSSNANRAALSIHPTRIGNDRSSPAAAQYPIPRTEVQLARPWDASQATE